jgi:hypothetical protein
MSAIVDNNPLSRSDLDGHYWCNQAPGRDSRGIDIAIGVWREGIGNVRTTLKNDNLGLRCAPNGCYKEKLSHYIDAVERYDH